MVDWGILKSALSDTFSGIQEHGLLGNLEKSVSEADIPAELSNIAEPVLNEAADLAAYTPAGAIYSAIQDGTMEDIIGSLPGVGDNPTTAEFWGDIWNQGGLDPNQTQDLGNIGHIINATIGIPQIAAAGTSRLLDKASGPYSMQDELDEQDKRHSEEKNELYHIRDFYQDDYDEMENLIKENIELKYPTPAWNKKSTYRNMFPEDSFWPTLWKASKDAYKTTFPLAAPPVEDKPATNTSRVHPLSKQDTVY